jgi:hypothetical protein
MKENHVNIIIIFVPGGCTGIWQPLYIGVQRVMKLSIKRSAHRDIIDKVSAQLGGLYTPRVNPYGIHGFHPLIPWIPYGMVLGEVPAIFWVHGHLGFHMEWS